ncbi:sensor histidine kinase [Nocardia sp. BMG51109]|uniref:sensor histidine kinase n=1 Tax=Nocardia sp. BMG51109 TaxID=1056816 RepID=UPI000463D313|nr:histidine kinase [Nocardia sp. BMG51109]
MDVSTSLARQSITVAVVAAAIDCVVFALSGVFDTAPWQAAVLTAAIAAADLALAAPPRTAGVVAAAQVALRLLAVLVLHRNGFPARFPDVGFLVAGYRAGAWLSGWRSLSTVAVLTAGMAAAHLLVDTGADRTPLLLLASTVSAGVVPWLVGRYNAARGAYIADLEQRARLREQEQRSALERAVGDERAAIARDLHDVISHHVSAIGIHAGAARLALTGTTAPAAARSLSAVEAGSRAAMVDLRRQLDLLHGREDEGQRQPGLDGVDELAERIRAAGLGVRVDIRGAPAELPQSLNITLYRVAQELLTNALRHGDGGDARLTVRHEPDRIVVDMVNTVAPEEPAADDTSVHSGLRGIRERAELFGGTAEFGRIPDEDVWRSSVSVPIGAA